MKIVRQRDKNDCAVAALAMALDASYETVRVELGDTVRDGGVNEMYVRQYLWDKGYALRQLYERELPKGFADRETWPPAPFAHRHVVYIRPHHWVAMDANGVVIDPQKSNPSGLSEYSVYSVIGITDGFAAPEMLSALRSCVEALNNDHPGSNEYWASVHEAEAVIAKAEGRQ